MSKSPQPWYVFIVDHDQKLFSIQGPMSTDHELNEKVLAAHDAGRNIRHSVFGTLAGMRGAIMQMAEEGYQQIVDGIIEKPKDRSREYQGDLPSYAKYADRTRVIKLRCGHCRVTRFAEMTVEYPGQEGLHKKELGTYEARCLMCGNVANDPYNWHR